jgi:predicted RNA methylase
VAGHSPTRNASACTAGLKARRHSCLVTDNLSTWLQAAEERYLADLTPAELTRALRALSSCYVERRAKLSEGQALAGTGKRAAFALFYGPLHFLTIREIAKSLLEDSVESGGAQRRSVIDLGCGTGAAGAAWALVSGGRILGFDVNPWAVREAAWTYRALGVAGQARHVAVDRVRWPEEPADLIAAFVLNELPVVTRDALLPRLLDAARHRHRVLIVEPIARRVSPWFSTWQSAFEAAGGRAADWRFRVALPALVQRLDKAVGLDHRELTARTLTLGF